MKTFTTIFVLCYALLPLLPHHVKNEVKLVKQHQTVDSQVGKKLTNSITELDDNWVQSNAHIKAPKLRKLQVVATHYDANCTGCIGITYTGVDVRSSITLQNGVGIVAVDPDIIPLHSTVIIDGKTYQAEDIGSDIKGHRIDILVESREKALELGVKEVEVWVMP